MWLIAKARFARSAPHERVSVRAIGRCTSLHLVRTPCGLKPRCDQQTARLASAKVHFRETLCCEIAYSSKAIKVAKVSA